MLKSIPVDMLLPLLQWLVHCGCFNHQHTDPATHPSTKTHSPVYSQAILVSVAIAGSIFPLVASVFWKLLELWGGDDYTRVGSDSPGTTQLLDYNDVFETSDDDEEIVPWREDGVRLSPSPSSQPQIPPSSNSKSSTSTIRNPTYSET